MKMHTYVNLAGKCAEAFRFYEERPMPSGA